MRVLAAALALLALGAPDAELECDVLWLKNGHKLEGLITGETDKEVFFKALLKGRKGETISTAATKLRRGEIDRIERMPDGARRVMERKAEAFGDRRERLRAALDAMAVTPARVLDQNGIRTCRDGWTRGWPATTR